MRIGILQTGHAPDEMRAALGDYDGMFARLLDGQCFHFAAYDVEHMQFPDRADECDGWLVTGSRHGAYEDHPFIAPLEAFLRDAIAADIPVVGVCFGHQIVAQALGGKVEKFAGGWAVGRRDYETVDGPLRLNAWHQDQVTSLPEGATVLASNAHCDAAIVSYGRRAWTIQPHPEFGDAEIAALVAARGGSGAYPPDMLEAALSTAQRGEGTDAPRIARAMAAFLRDRSVHAAL